MRATKMLKGLDHVSYVERLRAVTVSLLEQRKLRETLPMYINTWWGE